MSWNHPLVWVSSRELFHESRQQDKAEEGEDAVEGEAAEGEEAAEEAEEEERVRACLFVNHDQNQIAYGNMWLYGN